MAKLTIGGRTYEVEVRGQAVAVDGHEYAITRRDEQGYATITAGGVAYRVQLPPEGERHSGMALEVDHRPFSVDWDAAPGRHQSHGRAAAPAQAVAAPRPVAKGGIQAQMTGRVIAVRVKAGERVSAGQVLLLLEAMKMENEIKAPADGTITEVLVVDGQRVAEGETLVVLA